MAVKIAAFLITLVLNAAAGVVMFFFLIVALNGFQGSDAEYGIIAYIAAAVLVSLIMATGAAIGAHIFKKRGLHGAAAVAIPAVVLSAIGAGLKFVCAIIGIAVADYVRVNY